MTIESSFDTLYLKIFGLYVWISTIIITEKMKHNAALIFIGGHITRMLLNNAIFNTQPRRSKMLNASTTVSEIHTIILVERGRSSEYHFGLCSCSRELSGIVKRMYLKIKYYYEINETIF
jgi:hypothetical protein